MIPVKNRVYWLQDGSMEECVGGKIHDHFWFGGMDRTYLHGVLETEIEREATPEEIQQVRDYYDRSEGI